MKKKLLRILLTVKKSTFFVLISGITIFIWTSQYSITLLKIDKNRLFESIFPRRLPFLQSSFQPPKCLWPQLDPWDPEIKNWISKPPKTVCPKIQPEFAILDKNGNLHMSKDALNKKNICFYRSIGGSFYPNTGKITQ